MFAMVLSRVGGPEVLEYLAVPTPVPAPGEVLIKIACAGVNPADWKDRQGHLEQYYPYQFPYIVGFDAAGVVEKIGAGITEYRVGDRVITCSDHGQGRWGTYAEYVATSIAKVARLPRSLSFAQGATIPISGLTAWQSIFMFGGLQAGQTILIHGAAGGVGSFAVQFAKAAGAKIAATCSAHNIEFVKTLGADLVLDYRAEDIPQAVRKWASTGVDMVLDAVSCGTLPTAFAILRKGGILVSVPTLVGDGDIAGDMQRAAELGVRKVFTVMSDVKAGEQLDEITALIERGVVRAPPLQIFPLQQAAHVHALLEAGGVHGKLILQVADLK
jgi:NADPH2:quinone reductase